MAYTTIDDPSAHFQTTVYTGNNTAGNAITNTGNSDLKPDLIFLDIEMPDMNGFDVLASLEHIDFQTIFVTAHSHYAIQAIRFNALDYLV